MKITRKRPRQSLHNQRTGLPASTSIYFIGETLGGKSLINSEFVIPRSLPSSPWLFSFGWRGLRVRVEVKRYETYLQFFLEKSDEMNIADIISFYPDAQTTIYRHEKKQDHF